MNGKEAPPSHQSFLGNQGPPPQQGHPAVGYAGGAAPPGPAFIAPQPPAFPRELENARGVCAEIIDKIPDILGHERVRIGRSLTEAAVMVPTNEEIGNRLMGVFGQAWKNIKTNDRAELTVQFQRELQSACPGLRYDPPNLNAELDRIIAEATAAYPGQVLNAEVPR